jgi:hypothetical protein
MERSGVGAVGLRGPSISRKGLEESSPGGTLLIYLADLDGDSLAASLVLVSTRRDIAQMATRAFGVPSLDYGTAHASL